MYFVSPLPPGLLQTFESIVSDGCTYLALKGAPGFALVLWNDDFNRKGLTSLPAWKVSFCPPSSPVLSADWTEFSELHPSVSCWTPAWEAARGRRCTAFFLLSGGTMSGLRCWRVHSTEGVGKRWPVSCGHSGLSFTCCQVLLTFINPVLTFVD